MHFPAVVLSDQPLVPPSGKALLVACLAAVALTVTACGSTSTTTSTTTDLGGPSAIRCSASITTSATTLAADGGATAVSINSARDCTWEASSEASWLSVGPVSGQGTANINVTAAANPQAASRTGAVVVNDQILTFTQEGKGCGITLSGPTDIIVSSGGRNTLTISTLAGCAWTVASSATWLVPTVTSGSGAASVAYDAQANTGAAREATLTVGTRTFLVSQAPNPQTLCTFTIDSSTKDFSAAGGQGTVAVTTQAGCAWSSSGGSSWVTIDAGSGTGSGTARYTVAANNSITGRPPTTLTIAGRAHTVTQQGIVCTVSLSPTSQNFVAGGGSVSVQVTTPALCPWTATSNAGWVAVGPGSGTGPGSFQVQVQANTLPSTRSTTVSVSGGQTFNVTQDALPPCSYNVTPASRNFAASGGSNSVNVTTTSTCPWTATVSANTSWITVATSSGSGNASIGYTVAANTEPTTRTGSISVGGKIHTITQDAAVCTYSLTPTSRNFTPAAASSTVQVTTANGCAWTAVVTSANTPWLTVALASASGGGPATISYSLAQNTGTASRTGTITIGGQAHTVTQDAPAPPCTYALSPTSRNFTAATASSTVRVTTATGCAWTAVASSGTPAWITVTPGSTSGSGTFDVAYSVAQNTGTASRSGTITIGGQTHSVTQDAPCTYALSPASRTFNSNGNSNSVTLTTGTNCAWTATSSDPTWLTISNASGTGGATINYTVAAWGLLPVGTERTATITVNGQVHTVTQRHN